MKDQAIQNISPMEIALQEFKAWLEAKGSSLIVDQDNKINNSNVIDTYNVIGGPFDGGNLIIDLSKKYIQLFDKFGRRVAYYYQKVDHSNSIAENTIKIGNFEVTQNDFTGQMYWEDAKKVCESLGKGWRLPTKEELNIMYQNKSKIGAFTGDIYWSLTELDNNDGFAWYQNFNNGNQRSYYKSGKFYVRAIRSF